MKQIERSFWERRKKFLEPMRDNTTAFYKWIFVSFLWAINWVIHVLFLERVSYILTKQTQVEFDILILWYLAYILSYEIINFSVKKWWWVETVPFSWKSLSHKYMEKYVKLDNNQVEKEGTWRLITIIWGWIKQWWFSITNVIRKQSTQLSS